MKKENFVQHPEQEDTQEPHLEKTVDTTENKEEAALASLEAELAATKDQLLRAMAETENVRRRALRDREEASKYAVTHFAREILSIGDNLNRALESIASAEIKEEMKPLVEGVEITQRELQHILEKFQIKPLSPLGEKFHPEHHQAMFEVEDESQTPGTVVQVLQIGYLLHDRLLRPALVGVAKGTRATSTNEANANQEREAKKETR